MDGGGCSVSPAVGGQAAVLGELRAVAAGKFSSFLCVFCVGFVCCIFVWWYLCVALYGSFVWECCVEWGAIE